MYATLAMENNDITIPRQTSWHVALNRFLAIYNYETNAVVALPIANFSNECILAANQQLFELINQKAMR